MSKKLWFGIVFGILVIVTLIIGPMADSYIRDVANQALARQIDQRRPELEAQMKSEIKSSIDLMLKNKKARTKIALLLQDAVAVELEANGEKHIRKIIMRKYPALAAFLDGQPKQEEK